jgi:hypothetical protein
VKAFFPTNSIISLSDISYSMSYEWKNDRLSVLSRHWFFQANENFGRFENHKFWPRHCRSRASTRGRYILSRVERIDASADFPFFFLRRVFSEWRRRRSIAPVFAVQTSLPSAHAGRKNVSCKLLRRKSNKVHVENVDKGKIGSEKWIEGGNKVASLQVTR